MQQSMHLGKKMAEMSHHFEYIRVRVEIFSLGQEETQQENLMSDHILDSGSGRQRFSNSFIYNVGCLWKGAERGRVLAHSIFMMNEVFFLFFSFFLFKTEFRKWEFFSNYKLSCKPLVGTNRKHCSGCCANDNGYTWLHLGERNYLLKHSYLTVYAYEHLLSCWVKHVSLVNYTKLSDFSRDVSWMPLCGRIGIQ